MMTFEEKFRINSWVNYDLQNLVNINLVSVLFENK